MSEETSTENTSTEKTSLRGVGLAITNLGLAFLFALFAYGHAVSFLEQPRLSVLLIVITETVIAVLLLVRRDPDETRHTWQTWIRTLRLSTVCNLGVKAGRTPTVHPRRSCL